MKHHEVFVACPDRREMVFETRDWMLMIGCETTKLLRTCWQPMICRGPWDVTDSKRCDGVFRTTLDEYRQVPRDGANSGTECGTEGQRLSAGH
jgi:hypothetical protein